MNRKTKLVLLISLFSLVCLAILWGRWFPDNREQDTLDVGYQSPDPAADPQVPELHIPPPPTTTVTFGQPPSRVVHLQDPPTAETPPAQTPPAGGNGGAASNSEEPGTRPDPQAGWRQYEIQANDRLWKIAARFLGDGRRYDEIIAANQGLDAQRLRAGKVIRIPPRDAGGAASPPAVATPPRTEPSTSPGSAARTYKVRSGDCLARIARTQMGAERHWRKLAEANGIEPPYVLQLGQVLTIPQ